MPATSHMAALPPRYCLPHHTWPHVCVCVPLPSCVRVCVCVWVCACMLLPACVYVCRSLHLHVYVCVRVCVCARCSCLPKPAVCVCATAACHASSAAGLVSGRDAFLLYDTFGFPLELTQEMAEQEGLQVTGGDD